MTTNTDNVLQLNSCWNGVSKTAPPFLKQQVLDDRLTKASLNGQIKEIELLLDAGAHVDGDPYDRLGHTPLLAAAARGHEKACERLLKAGAKTDIVYKLTGTSVPDYVRDLIRKQEELPKRLREEDSTPDKLGSYQRISAMLTRSYLR